MYVHTFVCIILSLIQHHCSLHLNNLCIIYIVNKIKAIYLIMLFDKYLK
jgi:hypothetical protein